MDRDLLKARLTDALNINPEKPDDDSLVVAGIMVAEGLVTARLVCAEAFGEEDPSGVLPDMVFEVYDRIAATLEAEEPQ